MVQSIDDARRRQQRVGRVPPHNLEAEESLLGAMLLSGDAIAAAVNIHLGADDFYKPAHGHIYDAICTLYAQGEPVDPVTVAEELRRADLHDLIGGLPALLSLEARTPATSNASRYARIVEDHALLRRLIGVAGEIAELGYDLPEDVAMAIDRAEAMVYEVAQKRVTDSMVGIGPLLEQSLDHIEALYERGEEITGIPTGYTDLDEMLAGLQPSNLVIVGARPAMGKALALDTPIATPDGWTTMGEVQVGDEVFDEQGRPCKVTYVSPIFVDHDCFEVTFDEGSRLIADAEHQWFAYDFPAWKSHRAQADRLAKGPRAHPTLARDQSDRKRRPRVVTTQQMYDEGVRFRDQRPNWYLPLSAPIECPDVELPVDPYVLGCWLGDGSTSSATMWIDDDDAGHFVTEFEAAGYPLVRRPNRDLCYAVSPVEGTGKWQGYRGPLRVLTRELQQVGLLGGAQKHIPAAYLRASAKPRLALLQGLMDTDGTVEKSSGTVRLCLANWRLLDQARELACSLGHKAGPVKEKKIRLPDGRIALAWEFNWTPLDPVFRMDRKAELLAERRSHRRNGKYTRRHVAAMRPVPSVPVRCIAVDSPNHLYLAGRSMIPTHNTSMALGMAAHAAMHAHRPVLIFSLEMSHLELTQRLLCAEARVDASRLRTGRLQEPDWPKISHAVGRLGEANIFIDDNPHLTVMEIRAKARRLKSRMGDLGLIVVDYLQLMTGRPDAENRQVEVSEISRGLKILARELECPVIGLSQLSRSLEQRADKRPMLADLRESGCVPASTRILRADNGQEVTIGELVLSQEEPLVWSVDEHQRLVAKRLVRAFPSGRKPVFRVKLASGRQVEATANHPFLTVEGWSRLDALTAGSFVATPRRVPSPAVQTDDWSDDEIILAAHLIGDGTIGSSVKYATSDPENKRIVEETAKRLFGIDVTGKRLGRTWQLWLPSPYRLTHGRFHPVRGWLEPHGLWGSRAPNKFIPEAIFSFPDEKVCLFLRHLWATDGSITITRNGRGRLVNTYYSSSSKRLARDVQRLLLRLGLRARISRARKDGYKDNWHVRIEGAAQQVRFLRAVGCHGARGECIPEAISILSGIKENPNVDLVPWEISARVKEAAAAAGVSHRQLADALGEGYCGSYLLGSPNRRRRFSRTRLAHMAEVVGSAELRDVATSDLFWDEIVEIVPVGVQPTFDATVEDTHNFIGDGVVLHNSLEQDADVVLFIYRDEIYNPESADRGAAEIIVAKHRNGPTGSVQLAFVDRYTLFANMAKGV